MVMRAGAGKTDRVRLARGRRALLVLGVAVALVAAGCGDGDAVGVGGEDEPGDDPVGNGEMAGCEVPVPTLEDPGPLELVVDPVDAQPRDAVSVQVVPPEGKDRTDVSMGAHVSVHGWQGDGWGEDYWSAGIPINLADDREASQEVVLELTRVDPDPEYPIASDLAPRGWDGVVLGGPEDMVPGHYRVTVEAQLRDEPPLDRSRAVFSVGCS